MKMVVLMWILTFSDLSGELREYDGTLDECLLNAVLFNQHHKNKYSGCFMIAKQNSYLPRE